MFSSEERLEKVFNEILIRISNNLATIYPEVDSLCIAGGCGLNCVANGKIRSQGKFKNIYVQPASGDAGGAIGAALYVWHHELVNPKKLKTFKKMLLTNGKLEVKRLNSWKNKQLIKDENTFDDYAPVSDLEGYLNILYSFRNEKTIADLFTKAQRLEIDEIDL